MKFTLFAVGLVISVAFWRSATSCLKEKTLWRFLQLLGAACLVMVVLAHVAEALHFLPKMGWGMPNSPGHYLDLVSAVLGLTLLSLGLSATWLLRRKDSM